MDIVALAAAYNTLFAGVLLFVLGLWLYFDRRRDPSRQALSAALIGSALWLMAAVLWDGADGEGARAFWASAMAYIAAVVPLFHFFFSYALFIGRPLPSWAQAALVVPALLLLPVAFASGRTDLPFDAGRILPAAHNVVFVASSLAVMLVAARRRDGDALARGRAIAVFVGTIVAYDALFAMAFGSLLSGTDHLQQFGALGAVAFVAGHIVTAYAVTPATFMADVRSVGIELFMLVAALAFAANAVVSATYLGFTVRVVVFLVLAAYGVFAMRRMSEELKRLREIESLHEQVLRINGKLIEADKMKTKFVSFASHQLRAPVGGIRSYLDMMLHGGFGRLSEKQKEVITLNLDAVRRLSDTIDTFLDVAKIELGRLELFTSEINVASLATKAVREIQPVAERKGVKVAVDFPDDLPNVVCDGGKLYHAIVNLVDNAIKYTEKGTVTVSARRKDGGVAFTVKDQGRGLSPEDRRKIDGLLAGDLSSVRFDETGGSGLGLYIVKNIIEAHHGELIVASPGKGQGSTFGFHIPLAC